MICVSRSSVRKLLFSGALAALLLCAPMQLGAHQAVQDREAPAVANGASALAWVSGLWSDLSSWLTGGVVPAPKPQPAGSDTDGGGCLDPHGGCGG